jgi:hypothetical protein
MRKGPYLNTKGGLRKGLLVVAEMLETKALIHTDAQSDLGDNPPKPNQRNFNLEISAQTDYDCGTVACIGGWCWLLNKEMPVSTPVADQIFYSVDAADRANQFIHGAKYQDQNLHELFYPPFGSYAREAEESGSDKWQFWEDLDNSFSGVTTEQAAKAIRNYLKDGNPDWRSVMTEENTSTRKG